jgi:hypothetical protein
MNGFSKKKSVSGVIGSEMVGYFSYTLVTHLYCHGDACVIAGTARAMKEYLRGVFGGDISGSTIRATSFGEIIEGMKIGGAYSFDKRAFERFSSLALRAGIPIGENFPSDELGFVRLQLTLFE